MNASLNRVQVLQMQLQVQGCCTKPSRTQQHHSIGATTTERKPGFTGAVTVTVTHDSSLNCLRTITVTTAAARSDLQTGGDYQVRSAPKTFIPNSQTHPSLERPTFFITTSCRIVPKSSPASSCRNSCMCFSHQTTQFLADNKQTSIVFILIPE